MLLFILICGFIFICYKFIKLFDFEVYIGFVGCWLDRKVVVIYVLVQLCMIFFFGLFDVVINYICNVR